MRKPSVLILLLAGMAMLALGLREATAQNAPVASAAATTETTRTSSFVDYARIANPALKTILQQIETKAAAINEFSYHMQEATTIQASKGPQSITQSTNIAFRRPNLFYARQVTKVHVLTTLKGQQEWRIADGKTLWMITKNMPGLEKEVAAKLRSQGLGEPQIQQVVQRYLAMGVKTADLSQFEAAGIPPDLILGGTLLTSPFSVCDAKTMTLESETSETWVIACNPKGKLPELQKVKFTFGKSDCMLRQVEAQGDKLSQVETISNIKINPTRKLSDKFFTYTPAKGVATQDITTDLLGVLVKAGF